MTTIRIAVLDDHALIIEAIKSLVDDLDELSFYGGFQSFESFQSELLTNDNPTILLLDIQLNEEDGIAICKTLTQTHPEIKILILSSHTRGAVVMDALKKGAKGFLPKNISKEDLVEACQRILEGQTYIHRDIALVPKEEKQSKYDYIPKLTRREKEVLKLIMEELTTAQIADKLCLTVSTVESHRASLFSKTACKNVVGLIKYTIEKGLLES